MSYAIDTNVLARSIEEAHSMHLIASQAIEALVSRGEVVCIFPQTLYEFWVIATRPRENNGLGLSAAETQGHCDRFERVLSLLLDHPAIYVEWRSLVIAHAVMGKGAHDVRIVAAMRVHNISHLITFNRGDFKRFGELVTLVEPEDVIHQQPSG